MTDLARSQSTQPVVLQGRLETLPNIARLTINRPHVHNALDERAIEDLSQGILDLGKDASVRAIVLASTGPVFSAGADLNGMKRLTTASLEENIEDAKTLSRLLDLINTCPKPVIACVQGAAFGGGVGLIAACDMAVASTEAIFCLSEVKWGLIPAMISPYIVQAIGQRQTRRYVLTADRMSADDALRLGLIHQVVEMGELSAAIESLSLSLLKGSPDAMAASKDLIHYVQGRPIEAALHEETARRLAVVRSSSSGKEGIEAFLAKRSPSWAP